MQFEEYTIVKIQQLLPTVFQLRIVPKKKSSALSFIPGQFFHIKNPGYGTAYETRPFSVTSIPSDNYLEFHIKSYGPWTRALRDTPIGESIFLFGPMGRFRLDSHDVPILMIAGGIGITPFLSMLKTLYREKTKREVLLVYANKTPESIFTDTAIPHMFSQQTHWKMISIVSSTSNPSSWSGRIGRITSEFIAKEVQVTSNTKIYICGSQKFSNSITEILVSANIAEDRIKKEIFSVAIVH